MKHAKDELISFQEILMDILYSHEDVHIIQQQLSSAIKHPTLLAWLTRLNPDMLEVAARMVQYWGIRLE